MKKTIYDTIAKATPKKNKEMRETLRESLINIGKNTDRPNLVEWAKRLNDNGLEMCLHLGFSERAFLEFLSGTVRLEPFFA